MCRFMDNFKLALRNFYATSPLTNTIGMFGVDNHVMCVINPTVLLLITIVGLYIKYRLLFTLDEKENNRFSYIDKSV